MVDAGHEVMPTVSNSEQPLIYSTVSHSSYESTREFEEGPDITMGYQGGIFHSCEVDEEYDLKLFANGEYRYNHYTITNDCRYEYDV